MRRIPDREEANEICGGGKKKAKIWAVRRREGPAEGRSSGGRGPAEEGVQRRGGVIRENPTLVKNTVKPKTHTSNQHRHKSRHKTPVISSSANKPEVDLAELELAEVECPRPTFASELSQKTSSLPVLLQP